MTKESFKQIMLTYLHLPYKWGGDDPIAGVDCSGLMQELLAIIGIDPRGDQTADGLYRYFKEKPGSKVWMLDTGSLVFYGSEERIVHIGMIFEGVSMLEAGGGGSRTNTEQDAIKQNAFVRLRPYTNRRDLVNVICPPIVWR